MWGDAEYTDGQINHSAFFGHHDNAVAEGTLTQRMPLLCIGKVHSGKSPPSNTAINRGDEPPRITHAMRNVKMRLVEATMSLWCLSLMRQNERMLALWSSGYWCYKIQPSQQKVKNVSGSKRKHGDKIMVGPMRHPLPPSHWHQAWKELPKILLSLLCLHPIWFNLVNLQGKCCTLSKEFPVLVLFNPRLLQLGSRVINRVDLDLQLFHGMIDKSVRTERNTKRGFTISISKW